MILGGRFFVPIFLHLIYVWLILGNFCLKRYVYLYAKTNYMVNYTDDYMFPF